VLLKGYHRWRERLVDHLQGMFAFVLVEQDSGRVVLARDRLGVKPLYLSESAGRLRFASTLPALVSAGGVDTSIDAAALHHYLSWHAVVPAPRTILAGVRKLPPATIMTIEPDGRRRSQRYWSADFARPATDDGLDADDWREAVFAALRRAVDRRMVADVPVGVLLSGGLDSSLIVALLAEAGQQELATFSIGFESVGGREGDEFVYSDRVAGEFETEHHRLQISNERMLSALEQAIAAMSEPMVSHDAVAFFLLSEAVSAHVKVVQSGQGADEVFAGYSWYPPVAEAEGDGFDAYAASFFDRSHEEVAATVASRHLTHADVSAELAARHFARPGADEPVDRALRLDTEVMLVEDPVKRVDNMTMAWGLEARVPFLDHELVELAAACPPELKLAQEGKGVLKDVGRRLLPAEVVDRPKGYFAVPALSHLRGEYLQLVREALLSPSARERGLFRPAEKAALLDAPNEHLTPLEGNKLWQLGLLELWLEQLGV